VRKGWIGSQVSASEDARVTDLFVDAVLVIFAPEESA
jgi:hypothetical protein